MNKTLLSLLLILFNSCVAFAGWENMNSGINDHLTGVVFRGQNGIVSGHKGLYYTTTGGFGPASWSRLEIADQLTGTIYNNTRFNDAISCEETLGGNNVYVCGRDTVNNQAIVAKINILTLQFTLLFQGAAGSSLSRIRYSTTSDAFFAVGNNGLMVRALATTSEVISTGFSIDFNSIAFISSAFVIASGEVIIKGTFYEDEYTFYPENADQNTLDVEYPYFGTYYGIGSTFIRYGLSVTEPPYNYGPLNGNVIINTGTGLLVGTDHGIYFSVNTYSYLEYQPSSLNYNIKSFWKGTITYACGSNGVILRATESGGATIPLAIMNVSGACEGVATTFAPQTGSSNSCIWLEDNVPFHTTCGSQFNYSFPPGQHNLQLRVTNAAGLSDTSYYVFTVVPAPRINMVVSISDSLLCKAESIEIMIDSSQQQVFYSLWRFGATGGFGNSPSGNNDSLVFETNIIDDAGNYYIRAQSSIGPCYKNFTDTIKIAIEETKADFHNSKINSVTGEETVFFQNCREAQNYYWDFPVNSALQEDSTPDVITSFNSAEETEIKLICWSDNGCYDTVSHAIPNIYVEPDGSDSCWALVNPGNDFIWAGYYFEDIAQISETSKGYIYSGSFRDETLSSFAGDSAKLPGVAGSYAAFSNFNGVLKWMVYTNQIHNTGGGGSDVRDIINACTEDHQGNFYLAGRTIDKFYDNSGDSAQVGDGYYESGFLVKLDSIGQLIWKITGQFYPLELKTDHSNNVYMAAQVLESLTFNDTLNYPMDDLFATEGNYSIAKFTPSGNPLWGSALPINYTNYGGPAKLEVDIDNNLYITGSYEHYVNFYSAGDTIPVALTGNNYGQKLFLAKYGSEGNVKWVVNAFTAGASIDQTSPYDMVTDSLGNSYISGTNYGWHNGYVFTVENTDGSISTDDGGDYFVMKIDSSGICQWIVSAADSYYGGGALICKNGAEISVIGSVGNTESEPEAVTFTSTNNHTIDMVANPGIYFLAVYDTAGVLLSVTKSSESPEFHNSFGFGGLFKRNGAYYLSENIRATEYNLFGSTINNTVERDGLILKFTESCGIDVPMCNSYVDLTINTCDSYTAPWGTMLNETGIYRDTIPTISGCDSVTTVNLTIGVPPVLISQVSCAPVTINGINYSESGNYVQQLQSAAGCDSIINLDLIIGHGPVLIENNHIECSGSYLFNDSMLTVPGIYQQVLQTNAGCDSTITLNLQFAATSAGDLDTASCSNLIINGINYSESGSYQQILTNAAGCDSLLTIDVTIVSLNNEISLEGNVFTAADTNAVYQWLNCATGEIITGENNWQFIAASSGSYAAVITGSTCSDTSSCMEVIILDITGEKAAITIFPNPASDLIKITMPAIHAKLIAELKDISGKHLITKGVENTDNFQMDLNYLSAGIYLLSVTGDDGNKTIHKVVKQ